ncbi:MAG: aminotransferase class I/II-fold pyridoxal phosphate-dependent enzyme [Peptococcaceae bacterium]|nr:aminotransferase class I/II-fold pyridoxal phosphate-dependent enzyme [Peptococcaceae bacterium]
MLPYGRQWLDEDDVAAVVEVLRSNWLTTGPKVDEFERAFAEFVGAKEAVAVSSGTAALHAAMYATGIGPGDEVIVPPMTFAATANCIIKIAPMAKLGAIMPPSFFSAARRERRSISAAARPVVPTTGRTPALRASSTLPATLRGVVKSTMTSGE